jgi:hypothetical protein
MRIYIKSIVVDDGEEVTIYSYTDEVTDKNGNVIFHSTENKYVDESETWTFRKRQVETLKKNGKYNASVEILYIITENEYLIGTVN